MSKKHSPPGPKPTSGSDDFDKSIGYLIADTARFVKRSLYIRIGQHGVRGAYWQVLHSLWQEDGVTQRELSNRLGLTEPSVLEMLRAMEREGLVRRERDMVDRRKTGVYLTDTAKKLETKLMKIAEANGAMMTRHVSRADEAKLRQVLQIIRQTLADDVDALVAGQQSAKALALIKTQKLETAVPNIKKRGVRGT
ncbi:MarR family winged helix-turn-helix transcriptional regulator [Bradyrhizobium septentrionale]|uniref:MarR family transcriptional regulator n=1 Tax=Bradyrhizobium septentrionale TaxID=1404411 RepID=A0A973W5I8_9BRAD|nr:MarR family winged helix-turn-helix transcriptional regulator [Bradyrhizobium septentrionale]UGY16259.1 MarR family winged helix-turn-helix transcriptional regulator [Bradyrhizobium septentrionale]UGY24892.1 MarR family winged helix-turn-helix transcriptional regulator [Bradyrhizobium septentrionale]